MAERKTAIHKYTQNIEYGAFAEQNEIAAIIITNKTEEECSSGNEMSFFNVQ